MEFRRNNIEVGNRVKPLSNEAVFRCKFLMFFNLKERPIQTYIQCEAIKNSLGYRRTNQRPLVDRQTI